jgi:hypothetical protein
VTITVNFAQTPAPGYTPRRAITLHNVEAVTDNGPRAVRVRMQFADHAPTFDHVVSVSLRPEQE